MRFIYGFIFGILVSVISAILYLAFAGGDYLLLLSPKYHELASAISSCQHAEQQRDMLAKRLESLEGSFDALTRRFNEIPAARSEPRAAAGGGSEAAPPAEGSNPR